MLLLSHRPSLIAVAQPSNLTANSRISNPKAHIKTLTSLETTVWFFYLFVIRYYSIRLQINQFLDFDSLEKSNNIYDIKWAPHENIFYGKSNDINLIP